MNFDSFVGFPHLSRIDVSGNLIDDFSALSEISNLDWLSLSNTGLTDLSVSATQSNPANKKDQ